MTPIARRIESFVGRVFTPDDDGYEQARSVWNGTIDTSPAIIARCSSTEDVVRAINYAVDRHLEVSIRGGGHNVAGTSLVEGGLVIDLSEMRGVDVDPQRRIARVKGGATLGDLDEATFEYSLITPTGFISETGIGGLSLKGGLGHTMRRFGLTCDNIVGAELVTADGTIRRITEDEPELLWALRGGPLQLGVVTEFEFRLHPIDSEVRLVLSVFPAEEGTELNRLMAELMDTAPRELGLVSFYATFPDEGDVPPAVRGCEAIVLFGMYSGDRGGADQTLEPLVDHPDLLADLGGWMSYPEAQSALDEEYPDGMRYYWKSLYLDRLEDEVIQILDRYGRNRPSVQTTLDLWNMGGAIQDMSLESSAFAERDARYMVAIEANWTDPADDQKCIQWAREVFDQLQPHAMGGIYMNFPGTRSERDRAIEQLEASHLKRLRAVQQRLDPQGLFA